MPPRISREEVAHVARLARLRLTEEELDAFTPDGDRHAALDLTVKEVRHAVLTG